MNPKHIYELIKQFGPGYGVPMALGIGSLGGWWAGRSSVVSLLLLLAAFVWLLVYLRKHPPDRPVKTASGKLGFYVARVEEDPGKKRQKLLLHALHDGIAANADLKKRVEVHDLCKTIPYGAPSDQAHQAERMAEPCNAALVIWLETTDEGVRVYHATVRPLQQRTGPLEARPVPEGSNRGRYFAGVAFGMLGEDEKAIAQFTPRRESPQRYAAEMGNLANVYAERPTGNRDANLRNAIRIYKEILDIFTRRDFPADWATVQNNLGIAYSDLPTGDREQNLQKAIDCFEAALTVRTRDDFPADWALTQNNLGNAYGELPTGDRGQNLQKAIGCYVAALTVRTRDDFPEKWAMTQNNLGTAYDDLPTGDRGQNLQKAIDCYAAALTVRTKDDFPVDWAMTQNNLGVAYRNLPTGDRARNLQKAIDCFEVALTVYTKTISQRNGLGPRTTSAMPTPTSPPATGSRTSRKPSTVMKPLSPSAPKTTSPINGP